MYMINMIMAYSCTKPLKKDNNPTTSNLGKARQLIHDIPLFNLFMMMIQTSVHL